MDIASFASFGFSSIGFVALLSIALVLSSYVKIVTVLGILRIGLGFGSLPSVFVTSGLAFGLSFFVMFPTLRSSAVVIDQFKATNGAPVTDAARAKVLTACAEQWRGFLVQHAHEIEQTRFSEIAVRINAQSIGDDSAALASNVAGTWQVLVPAFLVSELKEAFATGLSLFLPFLVIDLLIANILAAIGLDRMGSAAVSFPFKLLLFVMVDGWSLITTNLVASYATL